MMDTFDFYAITVSSERKRDLKGAERIESRRDGWAVYGTWPRIRRFPRYYYTANVGFVDVHGVPRDELRARVDARIAEAQALFPNARVSAEYHARD